MPEPEPRFNVGDTVVLSSDRRPDVEVSVTRVGRKYVYVTQYGRERQFDAVSGYERAQYGIADRIRTPEQVTQDARLLEVKSALVHRHNIGPERGNWKQSPETLERLLALLDGEEEAHA